MLVFELWQCFRQRASGSKSHIKLPFTISGDIAHTLRYTAPESVQLASDAGNSQRCPHLSTNSISQVVISARHCMQGTHLYPPSHVLSCLVTANANLTISQRVSLDLQIRGLASMSEAKDDTRRLRSFLLTCARSRRGDDISDQATPKYKVS
jgi:hypothetical protein